MGTSQQSSMGGNPEAFSMTGNSDQESDVSERPRITRKEITAGFKAVFGHPLPPSGAYRRSLQIVGATVSVRPVPWPRPKDLIVWP